MEQYGNAPSHWYRSGKYRIAAKRAKGKHGGNKTLEGETSLVWEKGQMPGESMGDNDLMAGRSEDTQNPLHSTVSLALGGGTRSYWRGGRRVYKGNATGVYN